jgi:hypothetical protein
MVLPVDRARRLLPLHPGPETHRHHGGHIGRRAGRQQQSAIIPDRHGLRDGEGSEGRGSASTHGQTRTHRLSPRLG